MLSRLCLALITLILLCPAPAPAFVGVASDGKASLRDLHLVIAESGAAVQHTLSARVDLRGTRITLLVPVQGLVPGPAPAEAEAAALDALLTLTSPRLEVFTPKDPCLDIDDLYALTPTVHPSEAPEPTAPGLSKVQVLTRADALDLGAWAKRQGLKLSAEGASKLSAQVKQGASILTFSFVPKRAGRGLRLPPLTWQAPLHALDLDLASAFVTPGQALPIQLVLAHAQQILQPKGAIFDMGTSLSLPEVAFEDPRDLTQAAISHGLRRKGRDSVMRLHVEQGLQVPPTARTALGLPPTPTVTRFALELGRGRARPPLELETRPFHYTFFTRWWFRRVWRQPLSCPQAPRYQNIVRLQQRAELMSLTALTGRPLADLQAWSVKRGYAQDAQGRLHPVKVKLR